MSLINRCMTYIAALTALLASAALSGCGVNDDTFDGEVTPVLYDIVTFDDNIDGCAQFSFRQVDDSPLITLRARNATLNTEDVTPGRRLYIAYQPTGGAGAYTSGDIALLHAYKINTATVSTEETIGSFPLWNRDKIYLLAAWRSGNYLNVQCRLTYSTDPRIFRIVADRSTLDDPLPDLYLVHSMKEAADNFERTYYGSFDISPVLDRPGCRGVRLHVADSNLKTEIYTFEKNQQ